MLKIALLLLISLFCACDALKFFEKISFNSGLCDEYFHGKPWPKLKNSTTASTVKLCQTQRGRESSVDSKSSVTTFYATLFNTQHRTPAYSANKVVLNLNGTVSPRPSEEIWKRVATGLCRSSVPQTSIYSGVSFVKESSLTKCQQLQAVNDDYYDNDMNLDRGHLSPNHINSRNKAKQLATFTLTNAAPQYADFNRHSWRIYECVTEFMILQLVPNEPVYILTGVGGSVVNESGDDIWLNQHRVKVPGYYWKAVCYPGNKQLNKDPWSYAIVQKNINKKIDPDYQNYITLKQLAKDLFDEPPFGPDCMNASFGKFATVFPKWDKFIQDFCYEPWLQIAEES